MDGNFGGTQQAAAGCPILSADLGQRSTATVTTFRLPRHVGSTSSHDKFLRVELDSHADTCVVGRNVLVLQEHTRVVNVSGFDPSAPARPAKIVDCAVKYTCPGTGDFYLLRINQALMIPEMEHCLLCPMQCRLNGVEISEIPKYLATDPNDSTHSITLTDTADAAHTLTIPLRLHGVVSYFDYTKPTVEEFEDENIDRFELTAESPDWDPYDEDYAKQEDGMLNYRGHTIAASNTEAIPGTAVVRKADVPTWNLSQVSLQYDTADLLEPENFEQALEETVNISLVQVNPTPETYAISQVRSGTRRGEVGYIDLATRWGIPLKTAEKTVQMTTQRGVRTVLHPTLSRRYPTNDRMLRYRRLPCDMYTDTLFVKHKSSRGNNCAQVFATDFGWSRTYGMKSKGEAHDALSLLFHREGVPRKMISDGSKEQKHGTFHKKCKDAGCYYRTTEPHSQWQNSAELEIRELKKGSARDMTRQAAPVRLWDYSLEVKSFQRSHTAHDIFRLGGRVPETIMSGETADISPYCEYGFWQWVMYRDYKTDYPEENPLLGKYLGPSIDVGGAMCASVMKENGQVVDRSTLRRLTTAEMLDANMCKRMDEFLKVAHQKWGKKTTEEECGPEGLNLVDPGDSHVLYEDEDGLAYPELDDELEEAEVDKDYYVNAEVQLPRGAGTERAR